jgi:hypothetical protein
MSALPMGAQSFDDEFDQYDYDNTKFYRVNDVPDIPSGSTMDTETSHAPYGARSSAADFGRADWAALFEAGVSPSSDGRAQRVESRIPGTPLKATDYAHLPYGKERFGIAMEVFTQLTAAEGNTLLLSRVGSVLSPQARSAMRSLRLRFLNFLHEDPHTKYVHIIGAGGAQALVLGPPPATESSLPRLRAEISAALLNEEPCLLRTLGSLLSLEGRRTLQVRGVKLSKFLATDPYFDINENMVTFTPEGRSAARRKDLEALDSFDHVAAQQSMFGSDARQEESRPLTAPINSNSNKHDSWFAPVHNAIAATLGDRNYASELRFPPDWSLRRRGGGAWL